MALVNAYIIFREARKMVGEGADPAEFLAELHAQLLQVTSADFIDEKNGEERPHPRVGRGIQMRSPAKKRRRAASDREEGSGAEEGGAGSGTVEGGAGSEGSGAEEGGAGSGTVEGGAGSDTDVGAEERSGGEGCAGEDDSE
ncbi:hypothetical protein PInf_016334 [Phytophthora infestans]|nr:hypothetical protein PInf_016334 [Phytophthora infestans]